jgi:non-canonical poly(A) RNA polymerase PAPD5/7
MRTRSQGDSYRPSERPSERPIDRGRDSYDSYHPAPPSPRDRDDMRSRADRYHQDQDDRSSMYRFGSSDSYRPEPSGNSSSVRPREEFSFRSAQAPPQDYPIHDGSAPQRARRRRNPNRQNADWQKYVKVAPHERALFQPRGTTPERMVGMNEGPTKFLAFDDLSDSRSDDMSLESASEEGEAPTQKKSRTAAQVEDDGASVPKWSNPDPFIVLPAEDPLKKKKKDIVQLIRKAKITAAEAAATTNAVADNDDFISLDDDETPPQAIPTGPSSFSHRNQLHPERTSNAPGSSFVAPGSAFTPINASSLGPPPGLGLTSESIPLPPPPPSNPPPPNPPPPPPLVGSLDQVGSMGSGNVWPPPSVEAAVGGGSNTRSHEPSQATRSNKRKRSPTELGDIIPEWVSDAPVGTRAPWTVEDHSRTENMGHW